MSIVLYGSIGSLLAGLMTSVGALPVLMSVAVSRRLNDALLGFAAGVMLAASFFSLLLPSLDAAEALHGSGSLPALIAVCGLIIGVIAIAALNEIIPHEHFVAGREGPEAKAMQRVWLFVLAITIHNFPEGLAVGVGFGGGDIQNGISLAIGIGLQNAPEGLAVAVALSGQGFSRIFAFTVAALTGLIEPIGGVLGAAAVGLFEVVLPWALAFAAGAMLYVINHEIIPETHSRGHQTEATVGMTIGLALMMFLDVSFG